MVLSVPPLLEEMGPDSKTATRRTLVVWQVELWRAAQQLRGQDVSAPDTRWMGTAEQLSSVIGGSVVIGSEGEEPDVMPLSSADTPTVKGIPADPLVRLEGAPWQSGRYVPFSVVIGTSLGIWPAALSVGGEGGRDARTLRDKDGRAIELQVIAPSVSRIRFRLVDTETKSVVSVADNVEALAQCVHAGPKPVPWATFLEGCLWGLPTPAAARGDCERLVANGPRMKAMAHLWGIEPLRQEEVPLLALLAFLTTAAELPEARALANELATSWDTLAADAQQPVDGDKILKAVEQLVGAMLPAASTPAVLAAAQSARALDAVGASLYLGVALLRSVSDPATTPTGATALAALDGPRARRSAVNATARVSTYITRTEPSTPASPARGQQATQRDTPLEVDSDGDVVLTPASMRKELKRLRRQAGEAAAGKRSATGRSGESPRQMAAVTGLPAELVDMSEAVRPTAEAPSGRVQADGSIDLRPTLLRRGRAEDEGRPTGRTDGPTMGECVRARHTTEVKRLIPTSADATPLRQLGARLSEGGLPGAPAAFAQAASTAATGIVPGAGTALEAEMLADDIAAVLNDLAASGSLPEDHPAFDGDERPADWAQAAARGRALILATSRAFRVARQAVARSGAAAGSMDAATPAKPDKVPEDAYVKVSEATTNSLKTLAASAGVINVLTTDKALRGEKLRGSLFETLTGHTKEALDAALPGELDYYVGMYGQAATAYLVSNSRSREEVSGRGVPAALVGMRWHLWLRALRWVVDVYGERRAAQRRADVEKLALSLLTGAVPSEPAGSEGEKLIIELLGGSKPHRNAEVEKEGGSTSTGTIGKMVGEAAQFSVRVAYRKWAKGLARCMGEVLRASRGRQTRSEDVVGPEGDFGVEEALLNVSDDLPAERLRSIGRFLLEEIHVACTAHRSEPAAQLPDIVAIVIEMGGDVFKHRRQEHQLETLAQAAAEKLTASLTERLKAVESKQGSSWKTAKADAGKQPASTGARGASEDKRPGSAEAKMPQPSKSDGKKPSKATQPAGADIDDGAISRTAKSAARALEESMTGDKDEGYPSKVKAVAALQAAYRKSVGSPPFKRLDGKEPCAWLALAGICKGGDSCKSCASGLSFDKATLKAVRAKCAPGLFDEVKRLTKEPG